MKQITAIRNTDGRFANVLTHRNIIIGKVTLGLLLFVLATAGCYRLLDTGAKFLHAHELVKYQIVKVEFHKPFEFVDNAEMAKRRAEEKAIIDHLDKWIEDLKSPDVFIDFNDTTMLKEEQIQRYSGLFWDHIWNSESTKGKNNDPTSLHIYCRNKGMWNEIGYSPSTKYCFTSEAEAKAFVPDYLQRNCNGMPLSQCLCRWNEGNKDNGKPNMTCPYSNGDLSLAN